MSPKNPPSLANPPNTKNQYTIKNCRSLLPNQSKWTHEDKVKKMGEAKAHKKTALDYATFFKKLVNPFNALAKELDLAEVTFLLAQSALESGWLNIENDWLNNPFGMTAGGKDNLGFDTIEQAIAYWKCLFGDKVRGAESMGDYMGGLKGYNTVNKNYYDQKFWDGMVATVEKKAKENGYSKRQDGTTFIFE